MLVHLFVHYCAIGQIIQVSEVSTLTFLKGEPKKSCCKALPQVLSVFIKNTVIIGFGMTLGFPTILIPGLTESNKENGLTVNAESLSWIGSINLLCVPIGCMLSGFITQPIGRKKAMQLVNIPLIIAWLLFRFSSQVWHIYLALGLSGLAGGLLEAPVITYVAEITQPHLRGTLSSTSTTATVIGIFIVFLLGAFLHWRMVALMSCIVPVLAINLLFFVPESPHWLIKKNKLKQAWINFGWLRGWENLSEIKCEFIELRKNLLQNQNNRLEITPQEHFWTPYTRKKFLWPYSLVIFAFFLLHFSGTTSIQTYSVEIFSMFKTPINKYHTTLILGVAQVTGCLICVCVIHCVGKRLLNVVTIFLTGLCYTGIGVYAHVGGIDQTKFGNATNYLNIFTDFNKIEIYQVIPTSLIIGTALFSHAGLRILPWVLIGEVFDEETRATASGLSSGLGYVIGFAACKTFLMIISYLTIPGTFWLYATTSYVGCVVLYFVLPETEGKSLKEISDHFSGTKTLSNNVGVAKRCSLRESCYINLDVTNYGGSFHDLDTNL